MDESEQLEKLKSDKTEIRNWSFEDSVQHNRKRRRSKSRHKLASRKQKKKRDYSSDSSASTGGIDKKTRQVVNERLLAKLAARGETLEERSERRAKKRADHISKKFGYTAEDNPFNDPNLHETFTWNKRQEKKRKAKKQDEDNEDTLHEIEKVRKRRIEREQQYEELQRIRAEESRMRELENYDEWARKEEEFHLQQQRQRSAIRLVEGREKPIDVLAKNLLLFGLSEQEQQNRATVKYQERYDALRALENLEVELEEPQNLLKVLKQAELEELLQDIGAFRSLEREAAASLGNEMNMSYNTVMQYWEALTIVASDEVEFLKSGSEKGAHAKSRDEMVKIFEGQSKLELESMQNEIRTKIRDYNMNGGRTSDGSAFDPDYWKSVDRQLAVYLAKIRLSDLHSKMLVRQLEKLELKKAELEKQPQTEEHDDGMIKKPDARVKIPENVDEGFGDLEEELGLDSEINVGTSQQHKWEDKYRPRKPRYFNRVKTGYDWNKYNQTHYDQDNPPPKIVQGYKFNIFYPDLIDPTKTPQFYLEPADADEFCIIRFHAGAPYEDIAFKIINREWNRSRKRGFRCTFERGVLSLYFNFKTHWYRR